MSVRRLVLPPLPPMGACRLARWSKAVGETFARDEPIAEVEADKALMEIRAPEGGRLVEQVVPEGAAVEDGEVVAVLELEGRGVGDWVPSLHYLRYGPET